MWFLSLMCLAKFDCISNKGLARLDSIPNSELPENRVIVVTIPVDKTLSRWIAVDATVPSFSIHFYCFNDRV